MIVIAIAGLVFGQEAAEGAIVGQLRGLMGEQAAQTVQAAVSSASSHKGGLVATAIGIITLIVTASGVFTEMQAALNAIWKAEPKSSTVSRLVPRAGSEPRIGHGARLPAAGVARGQRRVAGCRHMDERVLPRLADLAPDTQRGRLVRDHRGAVRAIYKVLPDKTIDWKDVIIGAVATSFLFSIGKFLIGLYIGSSSVASSYGAAGALAVLLLWIYYSAQIFLFGAEFTKAYAETHGSHAFDPSQKAENAPEPKPAQAAAPARRTPAGYIDQS